MRQAAGPEQRTCRERKPAPGDPVECVPIGMHAADNCPLWNDAVSSQMVTVSAPMDLSQALIFDEPRRFALTHPRVAPAAHTSPGCRAEQEAHVLVRSRPYAPHRIEFSERMPTYFWRIVKTSTSIRTA